MRLRVYLAIIVTVAVLTTILSRPGSENEFAALSRDPEEARHLAAHETDIRRQRDAVADTLLHGVPLRWECSLAPKSPAAVSRVLCDARDESGVARMHLIFQAGTARLDSISLLWDEGSAEGRLSPRDAEQVARAWLNRLRPGPWRPLGRAGDDPPTTRNTIFSRWAAPDCTAFVGIERQTGMPHLIRFRYTVADGG